MLPYDMIYANIIMTIKLNCVSNPISLKKKLRQKESHSACFAYNPTIHTTLTISIISLHKAKYRSRYTTKHITFKHL